MASFFLKTTLGWLLIILFVLGVAGSVNDVLDWQDRFRPPWWLWALFASLTLNIFLLRELHNARQAVRRPDPRAELVGKLIRQADSLIDANVGGPVGASQLLDQARTWRTEASLQIRSELGVGEAVRFERGVATFREYNFNVPGGHGTQIEATKMILRQLKRNLEDVQDNVRRH